MRKIIKIIDNYPEGSTIDYKWKFYDLNNDGGKSEFLKDVTSFANNLENDDKYIIFGVKEKNGYPEEFQEVFIDSDDSSLQQIIQTYIEPKVRLEIKKFLYNKLNLFFLRIFKNENRPYLFKKNILNYKIGDGFIRSGSSTHRLQRSDFDQIYLHKLKPKDRKDDLGVNIVTGYSEDDRIRFYGFKCLDVNVENFSNQSLTIEYEMKVFKSDCVTFFTEDSLNKHYELASQNSFISKFSIQPGRFDISFQEFKEFVIISRSINPQVSISQKETFEFIFGKYLFFDLNEEECEIKGELIFRSDSFLSGPLIKKFNYKIGKEK